MVLPVVPRSYRRTVLETLIPNLEIEDNIPGVMCGTQCRRSTFWCRDDIKTYSCDTGLGIIVTNDITLCQDPRVWANVSCSWYGKDGMVMGYGLRCTGQNMRCVYPWYTIDYAGDSIPNSQCPDKSDQVFNSSLTCIKWCLILERYCRLEHIWCNYSNAIRSI